MAARKATTEVERMTLKQLSEYTGLSEKHLRATLRRKSVSGHAKFGRWGSAEEGYLLTAEDTLILKALKRDSITE